MHHLMPIIIIPRTQRVNKAVPNAEHGTAFELNTRS